MQVKLNDLSRQHNAIRNEMDAAIAEVINKNAYIGGEFVARFETNFAQYLGIAHCIGCANGTDALEIALDALDLQAGDEVLVPATTWISTAGAVRNQGGVPVFVDVNENFLFDLKDAEKKCSSRTRGIIAVHLFGQAADIKNIVSWAKSKNYFVIEDCAQAHGATFENQKVGTFGDIGTFSFYPGKNLGALGDAGCMVTNSSELAEKCKLYRNHGQLKKHEHLTYGRNSRLDGLQAAVLDVKLKHLPEWTTKRQKIAQNYNQFLSTLPVSILKPASNTQAVYHLYVIQTKDRDGLKVHLDAKGIQTAVHYPLPLPRTQTFWYPNCEIVQAEYLAKHCLSLPIFPEMTEDEQRYVMQSVEQFFVK